MPFTVLNIFRMRTTLVPPKFQGYRTAMIIVVFSK